MCKNSKLYKAIRSCARAPSTPVLDDYWGKEIACPIPAAGARVTVRGTYATRFTGCAGSLRHPKASSAPPALVMQPTKRRERHNPSASAGAVRRGRSGNSLSKPLVRAQSIEVGDVVGEGGNALPERFVARGWP